MCVDCKAKNPTWVRFRFSLALSNRFQHAITHLSLNLARLGFRNLWSLHLFGLFIGTPKCRSTHHLCSVSRDHLSFIHSIALTQSNRSISQFYKSRHLVLAAVTSDEGWRERFIPRFPHPPSRFLQPFVFRHEREISLERSTTLQGRTRETYEGG